ncbi:MAG: hypothetical protein NC222_06280 [Staphylococcus sp.]|nr:hypothetical protein [Staphylococcus sp.]
MQKDWTGNKHATFVTLGASNHAMGEREEHDYYATHPIAAEWLLKIEPQLNNIWECCCGRGDLAKVFEKAGKLYAATDLIDRGYHSATCGNEYDLLKLSDKGVKHEGDIVTNFPYKIVTECTKASLNMLKDGHYLCSFAKLTFAEGKERRKLFDMNPPIRIWVSSSRISCAKNADFEKYKSSAACYAWFVWKKGYKGSTELKWFN